MPQSTDDDATDLGDIIVNGFRKYVSDVSMSLFSPEPATHHPKDPPPPPLTPRQLAIKEIVDEMRSNGDVLTPELRALMEQEGIGLHEFMRPGIYQLEFGVLGVGTHRQWVNVTATGSEILSGHSNGQFLDVFTGVSYEDAAEHGLSTPEGNHNFHAVEGTYGANQAATWAAMVAAAEAIQQQGLNYNFAGQNSNSVFDTIRAAGGLGAYTGSYAPGAGVDLTTRDIFNQAPPLSEDNSQIWIGNSWIDFRMGDVNIPTNLSGGFGDDVLSGRSGIDQLWGDDGNDILSLIGGMAAGGVGNDTLDGTGLLAVHLIGGAGNDSLVGSSAADFLDGSEGADVIHGGGEDDRLWGFTGNDILYGEDGHDAIAAGEGDDFVYGGAGNDLLSGNVGHDHIEGGDGNDQIFGGRDAVGWDIFSDTLDGGAGDDVIYGSLGSDTIRGGAGDDRIYAYFGGDQLWGGSGADTFIIDKTPESTTNTSSIYFGVDVIMDFESGVDKIDLTGFDIIVNGPTTHDEIHWWFEDGSTWVAVDMGNSGTDDFVLELRGTSTFALTDLLY